MWTNMALEVAMSAGLLGCGYAFSRMSPLQLPFLERDLSISQPFRKETVPFTECVGLTVVLPALLIVACGALKSVAIKTSSKTAVVSTLWLLIAFLKASGVCTLVTNGIKYFTARHRPNFFAFCNYGGYRGALEAGNFSAYDAATLFNALGDLSKCSADQHSIDDSQRSFPSGHASTAFTGCMFTVLLLRWTFRVPRGRYNIPALLCALPLVLSTWIALTRVRDRFHNQDDVAIGALIGTACAGLGWSEWGANGAERDMELMVQEEGGGKSSASGGMQGDGEEERSGLLQPLTSGAEEQDSGSGSRARGGKGAAAAPINLLLSPPSPSMRKRGGSPQEEGDGKEAGRGAEKNGAGQQQRRGAS